MEREWMDSEEELSSESTDQQYEEEASESQDSLEINVAVISDTLQRLCEKSKRQKVRETGISPDIMPSTVRKFVVDNVMYIDYQDLAQLIGMKADALRDELGALGIKVPVQSAKPWKEIEVGEFVSLAECAHCQVQAEHSVFSVGINDCRECYEENIRNWAEEGETIRIRFNIEE